MSGYDFKKQMYSFVLRYFFSFTNSVSVDPDEMQHDAAYHLGLHCLQNIRLGVSRIQRAKHMLITLSTSLNICIRGLISR